MTVLPAVLEKDWQRDVIQLARTLGWTVAHFRPAQTTKGWRTPVQADGAGFPDLVLARDRVVFAELKTSRGKLRPDQQHWHDTLHTAGAETYVWRPDDLDQVLAALQHRTGPQPAQPHNQAA